MAHYIVVGREVLVEAMTRNDGLGERPADGEPVQSSALAVRRARPLSERGEISAIARRTEIIPGRFVREIEQRPGYEIEGRQARGRGDLADHDIVGGEVERGDDHPEGDGFGDRPPNREFGKDVSGRFELRLLRARRCRSGLAMDRLSGQRLDAPAQAGQTAR